MAPCPGRGAGTTRLWRRSLPPGTRGLERVGEAERYWRSRSKALRRAAQAGVTSLVQYGAGCARWRRSRSGRTTCRWPARGLVAAFNAVNVSAGFVAGVRGKAVSRARPFMRARVRALLRQARVLSDETRPALTAGSATCTWPAPSSSPPLHTSSRTAKAVTLRASPTRPHRRFRDGYAGSDHLGDALHAWWCGRGPATWPGCCRVRPGGPGLSAVYGGPAGLGGRDRHRRPRRRTGQPHRRPAR